MHIVLRKVFCTCIVFGVACLQLPAVHAQEYEEEVVEEVIIEEVVVEDSDIEDQLANGDDEEVEVIVEEVVVYEEETAEGEEPEAFDEDAMVEEEIFEEEVLVDEEHVVEEAVFEQTVIEEVVIETEIAPGEYYEYTIIKGDTLWFIADHFYQDPFLWPEIHKENPYIKDPHWIYPDDTLLIPGIAAEAYEPETVEVPASEPAEDFAREPIEEEIVEEAALVEEPVQEPVVEEEIFEDIEEEFDEEIIEEIEEVEQITPVEERQVHIPEDKKYRSSSFVAPLDWQFDGYVIGEVSQKLMVSQGDDIYLDLGLEQGMVPRTRCIVYRSGRKIKDRATGKVLGRVVRKIAVVITGYDIEANVSTARVLTSYDYIKPGDMVRMVKNSSP